jgi:hypothetical protein
MPFTEVEKCIVQTIIYFNIFDFPLTSWEVYKNLWQPEGKYTFREVTTTLDNLVKKKTLGINEGFYFLKRKDNPVAIRKQKYLLAQSKMKVAKRAIKLIYHLPFIRAIFVCNNLAYQNANQESDIDLAIITKKNRLWTARFFSTLLMKIMKKRPTKNNHKNKICLSFYIADNHLNLEKLAYPDDIHFIYWVKQFLLVSPNNKTVKNFQDSNFWTNKHLPNLKLVKTTRRWVVTSCCKCKTGVELILLNPLGSLLEKTLKKLQLKLMPKHLLQMNKEQNSNVVINDKILKFHDKDKRQEIKQKWTNSCKHLK